MNARLPERPSLSSLKHQAKRIVKRHHARDAGVCVPLRRLPRWSGRRDDEILDDDLVLADAQHAVALQYGFPTWRALRDHTLASAGRPEGDGPLGLTRAQRDDFRRRGLVRFPGLVPRDTAATVRVQVHRVLEEAGVCREGLWTADRLNGMADYPKVQSPLQKKLKRVFKKDPAIAELCTAEVQDIAEQLAESRLVTFVARPQLLFTPPNGEHWELPSAMWHMDVPRLGEIGCPGVQTFTCIDAVKPEAGATVVAAGSHRFLNDDGRVRSKEVKRRLGRRPWFKALFRKGRTDGRAHMDTVTKDGDVELQVVELTGEPGDVWMMDLRVLHSLAPNTTLRPRLMATQRYFRAELFGAGEPVEDAGER